LFAEDPFLARSPYTLKSQVSLTDFRGFVSALERETVTITNENFIGLSQLCDEFRFANFTAQLSRFGESDDSKNDTRIEDTEIRLSIPVREMNHCRAVFEDTAKFTAKGATFECNIGQAVGLSPALQEQLSVDACARTFELKTVRAVDSVRRILSRGAVLTAQSQGLIVSI
jgi:hypothetical protein